MEKLVFDIGEEFKLGGEEGIRGATGYSSIGELITAILPNIYVAASLILFFLLIGGGLMFMISAGRENPEGAATGKKAITAALIGFILIFASYWLIQIIEVVTGIQIFNPEGL